MKVREAVLVVDDQPNWREVFSSLLEDEYEVTCARSYEEAVHIALRRKTPFALAIIDVRLDDTDSQNEEGLRLFSKLKELSPLTSFMIVTGYPTIRTAKEALVNRQAMDYVLKYPEDGSAFSLGDFRRTVHRAVEAFVKRREGPQVHYRALVIEDEANWQETISSVLIDSDYSVDIATELEEAMEKIKDQTYNLIIVDLKLGRFPPQRGMDLLGDIREVNKDAGVIVVSAWDTSERVRDAFARYRVQDFLMKRQFDLQLFREAVRRAESAGNTKGCVILSA
jgi:DNA-binding NtrC family response regulator